MRCGLSRPIGKAIYAHNDVAGLDAALQEWRGKAKRALVVSDGIFSMRGDHAPVDQIMAACVRHDSDYERERRLHRGRLPWSWLVRAYGTGDGGVHKAVQPVDILVGTLGKAFGVNGGYVTANAATIQFLRESSQMYIYSNPITVGEAAAALRSIEIVDSDEGIALLDRLRSLTKTLRGRSGPDRHRNDPWASIRFVPLMIPRHSEDAKSSPVPLRQRILTTGLAHPVVPRGDEEIRTQINADHTEADIDHVLGLLQAFRD